MEIESDCEQVLAKKIISFSIDDVNLISLSRSRSQLNILEDDSNSESHVEWTEFSGISDLTDKAIANHTMHLR